MKVHSVYELLHSLLTATGWLTKYKMLQLPEQNSTTEGAKQVFAGFETQKIGSSNQGARSVHETKVHIDIRPSQQA